MACSPRHRTLEWVTLWRRFHIRASPDGLGDGALDTGPDVVLAFQPSVFSACRACWSASRTGRSCKVSWRGSRRGPDALFAYRACGAVGGGELHVDGGFAVLPVRTIIGYTTESIAYAIGALGLVSFASQALFGTEWGWMHKVVDLLPSAYLGIVAVGLALIVGGVKTRKTPQRQKVA